MHILITRPEPEASELARALRDEGLKAIVSPGMVFEPMSPGFDLAEFFDLAAARLAVFCSPRAVEFGLRQLPSGFLEDTTVAAIGPASAAALEAAGYVDVLLPGAESHSEALLRAVDAHGLRPGHALVFTSPGGRELLRRGLARRGWEVRMAHVYRAVMIVPGPEVESQIAESRALATTWTSVRAMEHFALEMSPAAWEAVCAGDWVVTSQRLVEHAQQWCKGRILLAEGPGNAALVEAISRHCRR